MGTNALMKHVKALRGSKAQERHAATFDGAIVTTIEVIDIFGISLLLLF